MRTLPTNEKKGITVKIDANLHTEIRQYLDEHEMTMAEFITLAVQDELHPKLNITEAKNMGNMRTLAFQVPGELFHKIKDYLQRNNMSQKDFVIGLIENEIERDLAQRAAQSETQNESEEMGEEHRERQKTSATSDCESVSEEVKEQSEEQEYTEFSDNSYGEEDESLGEDKEMDEPDELVVNEEQGEDHIDEQDEVENIGLSMNM